LFQLQVKILNSLLQQLVPLRGATDGERTTAYN
jgi:hypothetical protein